MLVGIDQAVYSSGIHYNDDEEIQTIWKMSFICMTEIPEWVAQKASH